MLGGGLVWDVLATRGIEREHHHVNFIFIHLLKTLLVNIEKVRIEVVANNTLPCEGGGIEGIEGFWYRPAFFDGDFAFHIG
jgi:hypothetical protein